MVERITGEPASHEDVTATFGALDSDKVARIVKIGATKTQLLEAKAWLTSDDHVGGDLGKPPPSGAVAEVCDILALEELDLGE